MEQRNRKKKKGHGCLGFGIGLVITAVAVFCILLFATDVFSGPKNQFLSLFFQRHYTAEVAASSEEFKVDENLIYAVIKTESKFDEDAVSGAGAIGLMQLMPDTFTWLQERLDDEVKYTAEDLKNPAINIRYGTYYLAYLTELYGDTATAVAAYNAGTSNVDRWLEDPSCSENGKTLSAIPYAETDKYVEKVMKAQEMYRKIYG